MQAALWKLATSILILGLSLILSSHSTVQAQAADFSTDLETTYTVATNGQTTISHRFTITNNTPTRFLKQYALKTNYPELEQVSVISNGQKITPHVVSSQQGTSIALTFPDDLVGEGKQREITISYANQHLATLGGKVMEVHIPKLEDSSQYANVKTVLKTPAQFGLPSRINPQPSAQGVQQNSLITIFEQNADQAISALFGDTQIYLLTLRYQLENPGSATGLAQIALPPDTPFQRLNYLNLDPMPHELKTDRDGNWIATYRLPPATAQTVHLSAKVKITLEPDSLVPIAPVLTSHTSKQEFWETDHPTIKSLAREYPNPWAIYSYVTEALEYSRQDLTATPPRLGAVEALNQPTAAVCQEFTDLFIAIARSAGIPTRRLTGYAYTQNEQLRPLSLAGDILHAWPEYFNTERQRWVSVDPTWGNTTGGIDYFNQFDLNHIVFAINGESSTIPYPAGSYKPANSSAKDIEVQFTDSFEVTTPEFDLKFRPRSPANLPIPGLYWLSITNQTGQAWYDITVSVESQSEAVFLSQSSFQVDALLPYQTQDIPITVMSDQWRIFTPATVAVSITGAMFDAPADQTSYDQGPYQLAASHYLFGNLARSEVLLTVGAGFVLVVLGTGSLLVSRQRGKHSIRRKS
jgi:transglutaminase-like putative cysteine protease